MWHLIGRQSTTSGSNGLSITRNEFAFIFISRELCDTFNQLQKMKMDAMNACFILISRAVYFLATPIKLDRDELVQFIRFILERLGQV